MDRLRLILDLRRCLLVGGQTSSLLLDAATAREASGAPMIPASAIKGALRIEFERFLAGLKHLKRPVCTPGRSEHTCLADNRCLACRLFGGSGKQGKLRFSDAVLVGASRKWYAHEERASIEIRKPTGRGYITRHGVAINRVRKAAQEQKLFDAQVVAPPAGMDKDSNSALCFEATIEVRDPLTHEELELLRLATENLMAIGADKSRGLGHLRARIERLERSVPGLKKVTPESCSDVRMVLLATEYVRVSGIKVFNNFLETTDYLPGSAVRGAVAAAFAQAKGGWQDESVRDAFLRNPVQFSNFYPSTQPITNHPKPIPLSARTCKSYPGYEINVAKKIKSHGAKDILVASTVVKLLREIGMFVVLEDRCSYPDAEGNPCNAHLKGLNGFYRFSGSGGETCQNIQRRLTTKTAINRSRLASAEGQLYSYEAIDTRLEFPEGPAAKGSRLRFIGTLTGLPDELCRYLTKKGNLHIGGARSRGFGKVKIERVAAAPLEENEQTELERRLTVFTESLQKPLRNCSHPRCARTFFALTCTSDLMPPPLESGNMCAWLRKAVQQALCLAGRDLLVEKVLGRTGYCAGFNEALGIRKDLRGIVVRGSAFVFSCDGEAAGSRALILQNLPNLLRSGLGCRRQEGFGRFSFCDEFHLQRTSQL